MSNRPTAWKPGQSGNPKGRPPKSRALTELLEKAGGKTVEYGGKRISGRRLLARLIWQAVTTGEVVLPGVDADGNALKLVFGPADWFDAVKWLYTHMDGPAPKAGDNEEQPFYFRMVEVIKDYGPDRE